ncbi:MAG TPA: DUF983 domain-containing protein [Gemmatimonadales bacterium]|nr:DUF983 domain-containing protein [Gemmatimonadales bacterium]
MASAPLASTLMAPSRPTMFGRALRRRCPACGGGPLFSHWLRMQPACPRCGLVTNRGEDGYMLGAVWFNLLAAELVNTLLWVSVAVATWPDVPWETLHWVGPVTAVLMPLAFYPFSKTLFLAFDLCFRPVEASP